MRALLVALFSVLGWGGGTQALAQWPPGPYTFVQGQIYELFYEQPALHHFLGGDVYVRYPNQVFEPVALLPGAPAALASMLSVLASNPDAVSPGIDEVRITIIPSNNPFPGPFGLDLPEGAMFGVRFQVKTDAPLGGLNIPTNFEFAFGDPAGLDETLEIPVLGSVAVTANIVAIPEAETWAMMLAGLALVGAAANRARRQA